MRKTIKIVASIVCVAIVAFVVVWWIGPPGPNIICQKQISGALSEWTVEKKSEWFPNVDGDNARSMAALNEYLGYNTADLRNYHYVAGLKSSDPKDLILIYMDRPSSRRWHGDKNWYGWKNGWIVMNPPGEERHDDAWSEAGEWVQFQEFTNRLAKTLHFLAENQRTNSANIIKEHSAFLASLQKPNR